MKKKRSLAYLALLCILIALAVPLTAAADGCPPENPYCAIQPPQSIEVNPNPLQADGSPAKVENPGVLAPITSSVLMPPPPSVDPLPLAEASPPFETLSVPMRYQDPGDATCGVQALGMAMDALDASAPTSASLLAFLEDGGMLYGFGTGVEELAYAAQSFGYEGSFAFHDWTLENLLAELEAGRPVVVALGTEGEVGHFVTVTGISPDGQWIATNDPELGEQVISTEEFLRLWALQGSSGVALRLEVPVEGSVDYAPWAAFIAGVMALISQTPLVRQRKGIGGLIDGGVLAGSGMPAQDGYHWVFKQVPVYETQEETITNTWYEDVPYTTTERYIMYYRKETVGGVPRQIVLDGQIITVYSGTTTRYVPVYGTRTVTNYTTVLRTEEEIVTKQVQVGTEWQWVLEEIPESVVVAEDPLPEDEEGKSTTTTSDDQESSGVAEDPLLVSEEGEGEFSDSEDGKASPELVDVPDFISDPYGWFEAIRIILERTNEDLRDKLIVFLGALSSFVGNASTTAEHSAALMEAYADVAESVWIYIFDLYGPPQAIDPPSGVDGTLLTTGFSAQQLHDFHQWQLDGTQTGPNDCAVTSMAMAINMALNSLGYTEGQPVQHGELARVLDQGLYRVPGVGAMAPGCTEAALNQFATDLERQGYTRTWTTEATSANSVDDLVLNLERGNPIIVYGVGEWGDQEVPHARVLVGYDPDQDEWLFLDPAYNWDDNTEPDELYRVPTSDFNDWWGYHCPWYQPYTMITIELDQ